MDPHELLTDTVAEVLTTRPRAVRVFIDRGMACVGCPFARFETVADVARVYGLDPSDLAHSLAATANASEELRQ